jgi:non-heme chloroperoxidase
LKLHYNISGSGETLIFLHGAYVNSEIWNYQYAYFKHHYRVLTVDLRGHGRSPSSELSEYSVATFGEDLMHLLDDLEIKKSTICGLSLGSMVAQYVAANYPSRVKALVLVGATASLRLNLYERIITTIVFPKWVAMKLFSKLNTRSFMKVSFFITWFMLGNKWLGSSDTREKIRKSIIQVHRSELKKIYSAVHSFRKQNLNSGSYPILLINGAFDSPVIHRHSRYITKSVSTRGTHYTLEGAGHACNHDQPLIFNEWVKVWLEKNSILPYNSVYKLDETKLDQRPLVKLGQLT